MLAANGRFASLYNQQIAIHIAGHRLGKKSVPDDFPRNHDTSQPSYAGRINKKSNERVCISVSEIDVRSAPRVVR
jgi:hypothetical protein